MKNNMVCPGCGGLGFASKDMWDTANNLKCSECGAWSEPSRWEKVKTGAEYRAEITQLRAGLHTFESERDEARQVVTEQGASIDQLRAKLAEVEQERNELKESYRLAMVSVNDAYDKGKAAAEQEKEGLKQLLQEASDRLYLYSQDNHHSIVNKLVQDRDRLRSALMETGRNLGAGLADEVSNEFLSLIPEEARLVKADRDRLAAEVEQAQKENAERDEFTVKRVRVLAKVLDCEPGLPDDATIIGCMGTILGMFRARSEVLKKELAAAQEENKRLTHKVSALENSCSFSDRRAEKAEAAAQQSAQKQIELVIDTANEWAMQYVEIDNAPMRVGDFIRAELSKGEGK